MKTVHFFASVIIVLCSLFALSEAAYAQLEVYADSACTDLLGWTISQVDVCIMNSTGDATSLQVTGNETYYSEFEYEDDGCKNVVYNYDFAIGECALFGTLYTIATATTDTFPTGVTGNLMANTFYGGTCESRGSSVIGRSLYPNTCTPVIGFDGSSLTSCNSTHVYTNTYMSTTCDPNTLFDVSAYPLSCENNTFVECIGPGGTLTGASTSTTTARSSSGVYLVSPVYTFVFLCISLLLLL